METVIYLCRSLVFFRASFPNHLLQEGSDLNLTCTALSTPEPPDRVVWRHNNKVPGLTLYTTLLGCCQQCTLENLVQSKSKV